jgi:hypothetical protein
LPSGGDRFSCRVGICTPLKKSGLTISKRSDPDNRYRTEPLRSLFDTQKIHKGGFYHDGRFATLPDVVNDYDNVFKLRLNDQEKNDLIEFLKSI